MTQWAKKWGWVAALLAVGALLRIVFVMKHTPPAGDALVYGDLAGNMLTHHVFGFTEAARIRPTLIRLPGYPVFLAACFAVFGAANYVAVLWVQVMVDLVSCCLLGALAGRLMGRRAGVVALGLAAVCPFTANYCALALTECLSFFCVALTLYSVERWMAGLRAGRARNGWLAGVGVGLSYGILLRPDQALVAVAVVPAMVWMGWRRVGWRAGLGPGAVVSAIVVAPLLLWGVRNWRVFHVIQPMAPRYANDPGEANPYGFQRWYRTWAIDFKATVDVYWMYDGTAIDPKVLPARAFDSAAQRVETQQIFDRYNQTLTSSKALDAAFLRLAEERVAEHPVRFYVVIPALKVADMWLRPRTEFMPLPLDWWNFRSHAGKSALCLAYALLDAAYLVLAAVGLWRWKRVRWSGERELAWAMVAFVMLRCALLWTIDNAEPRYTLECFPLVIVLAAFALAGTAEGREVSGR